MNIDWGAEIRRPVTLAVAALALIGWVIGVPPAVLRFYTVRTPIFG